MLARTGQDQTKMFDAIERLKAKFKETKND